MRAPLALGLLGAHALAAVLLAVLPFALIAQTSDVLGLANEVSKESRVGTLVFVLGHPLMALAAYRAAARRSALGAAAGAVGALLVNAVAAGIALNRGARETELWSPVAVGLVFGGLVVLLGAVAPVLAARRWPPARA